MDWASYLVCRFFAYINSGPLHYVSRSASREALHLRMPLFSPPGVPAPGGGPGFDALGRGGAVVAAGTPVYSATVQDFSMTYNNAQVCARGPFCSLGLPRPLLSVAFSGAFFHPLLSTGPQHASSLAGSRSSCAMPGPRPFASLLQGGCFAMDCMVAMANGSACTVGSLRAGDCVATGLAPLVGPRLAPPRPAPPHRTKRSAPAEQ